MNELTVGMVDAEGDERIVGVACQQWSDSDRRGCGIDAHVVDTRCGPVDEADRPVESAIEVEVRHVGGNHLHIAAVVAAHGKRQFAVACVGDVDLPAVVAAHMRPHLALAYKDVGLLSAALKYQQRTAMGIMIGDMDVRAVPGRSLIVVDIGVDGIEGIVAVGQCHLLPKGHALGLTGFDGAPHLPCVGHVVADELPTMAETDRVAACRLSHG